MRGHTPEPRAGRVRGWFLSDDQGHQRRSLWLLLAFMAMAASLTVRLLDVQVRQAPQLRAMAAAQHQTQVDLHARRGRILDSSGRVLATNTPVYTVFADPTLIPQDQRQVVATQLAPLLEMGPARLQELIGRQGTRYVILARSVGDPVQKQLVALNLRGIGTLAEERRSYPSSPIPDTSFAANLIGYVDADGHGQYGVESYYDAVLRGHDGSDSTVHDVLGNDIVLSSRGRVDPRDGRDLRLGLDSQVQYWAEQALAKGQQVAKAPEGEIVVMDSRTGSIRAWAQNPSYDANHFGSVPLDNLRDRSISDMYEPGSVMKVITFAGALNAHAITPDTMINEGPVRVNGYTIGDWDHRAHGNVSMLTVLEQSLNDGAIRVQQMEGNDTFYKNLLSFGIGSPTGVDLAGEVNQPLRGTKDWAPVNFATAAFGQGVLTTPVEMLAAVNAIANGGVWVQPHAVDAVIDPVTGQQSAITPATRRVMSAEASATLRHMMVGDVDDRGASGADARIPALKGQVAGKTGTSSVAVNGQYGPDVITSFAGFAPADAAQYTMLVIYKYPQTTSTVREGASLAAPVFRQVSMVIADLWRIRP